MPIINGQYDAPNVPAGPIVAQFNLTRYTGKEIQLDNNRGTAKVSETLVPKDAEGGIAVDVPEGEKSQDFDL